MLLVFFWSSNYFSSILVNILPIILVSSSGLCQGSLDACIILSPSSCLCSGVIGSTPFFLQHPTYHPSHHPGIDRHPGIILVSGVSDVLYLYHPDVILDMVFLGSVEASKL